MGLRDMYSAISGLQANSTWLDVIGNNISNVNTVAYKASRVEFADQFSQTLEGGQGDNAGSNLGGTDPEQIGLGTRVASIQTLFTEGAIQQTGNATDIAIEGNGFLESKVGDQTYYTRAGNLTFDSTGNLVDANGGLVQGFTASTTYTTRILETGAAGGPNLLITQAALTLNDQNTSAIGDININPNMVEPAKATTQVNFVGNLDSFQQANGATGGVLQLGTAAAPILPIATLTAADFNAGKMTIAAYGAGQALNQVSNLSGPVDPNNATPNQTTPVIIGGQTLPTVQAADVGNTYAWDAQPPVTPALTTTQTVYDSLGNPRQVTIQFYQVNDLGTAVPAVNVPPLSQVAYAYYAFDTTGGAAVSTANLIGGTGIIEGEDGNGAAALGYDRGTGDQFVGDLLYFNTDGSLASEGATQIGGGAGGTNIQAQAHIYLPPENLIAPVSPIPNIGAEVTDVTLNFGTAGILGSGERNGLVSDAEGSFQTVNGVNTYVPDSHSTQTQNGYADGTLQSISFDQTGTIQGTFSNGQTTALGQVVLASFENEGGLTSVGDNYYTTSPNTGAVTVGLAAQNGFGTIQGGSLEGSNVDLTVELTNMIIAQRGFEMNSRVITVENQNLQTLTQLGQ